MTIRSATTAGSAGPVLAEQRPSVGASLTPSGCGIRYLDAEDTQKKDLLTRSRRGWICCHELQYAAVCWQIPMAAFW